MKLRYVIAIALSIGITLGMFWGCVAENNAYSQAEIEPIVVKRMGVVDSIYTKAFDQNHYQSMSFRLYIIKVDNKEYIVNSRGGIVEHTK